MFKVVDSHHKVLVHWSEYRRSLDQAPRLITLDHHTDTSKPFRRYLQMHNLKNNSLSDLNQESLIKSIDFKNPISILNAVEKLNNDEHIVAAIKSDIISSAMVLAHNAANTDLETYLEHKIICRTVNEIPDTHGRLKPDCDTVLESQLLDLSIMEFNKILESSREPLLFETPYILDIDLDYFNTFKSIDPKNDTRFKALVKGAGLITIATEPEYVSSCALDPGLTSEHLLERLQFLFGLVQ